MNTLEERDNNLGAVNYEPLLKMILDAVKRNSPLFHVTTEVLNIEIDELALNIAQAFGRSSTKPLFENTYGTRVASVNFADVAVRKMFKTQMEQLREQLQTQLVSALSSAMPDSSIQHYASSLLTPLSTLKAAAITPAQSGNRTRARSAGPGGLRYAFESQQLHEQRLHLREREAGETPQLKGHKVTIGIKNIHDFDTQLVNGVYRHFADICSEADSEELDNTRAVLNQLMQDRESDFGKLKRIVSQQSLGRLQKEAKLRYLDFLYEGIKQWKGKDHPPLQLLRKMLRRLHMLNTYLNDPRKLDRDYTVSYANVTINYRDLFARADAFDILPIISEIEGSLGETFNKADGEQIFVSGIKLKLHGPVQTHKGEPVFDYYLTLLEPNSPEHQERLTNPLYNKDQFVEKVLKIMLLYYFVLFHLEDDQHDPVQRFEKGALPILRGDDEQKKHELLHNVRVSLAPDKTSAMPGKPQQSKRLSAAENINTLRELLTSYIKNDTTGPARREYPLHLELERGILEQDPSSMLIERKFFQDVLNDYGLEALKYLTIRDADAGGSGFCTLPVSIIFEPLYYFPAQEPMRSFTMDYDLDGISALPILFVPGDSRSKQISEQFYQAHKRVVFSYRPIIPFHSDDPRAFVYRFTFLLLAYLCLKLLADSQSLTQPEQKKKLFLPLVRLHSVQAAEKGEVSQEGSTIRSLSKVLAHMLAEEYSASSQGFSLVDLENTQGPRYKIANGLSSLYAVFPKRFRFASAPTVSPRLSKLAVIVVSSRKTDWNSRVSEYGATIFGEVIGMERMPDGSVRVEPLTTFSRLQDSSSLYTVPTAVSDEITACYEQGYRHFLYIAKAPYSSTLHISRAEESEELFFMSKEIIQKLMQLKPDIRIYPLYCDKYYAVNLHSGQSSTMKPPPSLYVDDTRELTGLVADPNQSSIVFFNLFNGITVGQKFYNGVISYATLVNMYDNVTYDRYIRTDLLDDSQEGSLKHEILDFLTLLHFSRYEKEKSITFKLEPYSMVIGDDSVGTLAQFTHSLSYVKFNALAFLTAVRGILNIPQEAPPASPRA